MALHIRDFRQNDASELTQLGETTHWFGAQPLPDANDRILVALRGERLAGATWFTLKGDAGTIWCIVVAQTNGWHSDVQELIAEASLWLGSRGAANIDIMALPDDEALSARLQEMDFMPDKTASAMRRLLPARSAA